MSEDEIKLWIFGLVFSGLGLLIALSYWGDNNE